MVQIGNFLFKYRNGILPVLFLGVFIPSPILFDNPTIALVLGIGIALLGQAVRAITIGLKYIVRGGRNRRVYADDLVTSGIFSHTRNPMYIGNILVASGMGFASNNMIFFTTITLLIIFIYQAIVLAEEDFLMRKFEHGYDRYMTDVNRWIPSLAGLNKTVTGSSFAWKRLIAKEHNSTYTGLTLCILLIAKAVHDNPLHYPNASQINLVLVITWITLSVTYLLIKVLKKSKRLNPEVSN